MNFKPVLVQALGKESGDRWILTGAWDGFSNLTGPWKYNFVDYGRPYQLTIPFKFDRLDGASVPKLVDGIVKMGGRDMPDEAWIPHDFFYNCEGNMPYMSLVMFDGTTMVEVKKVSKDFADRVFYNELKSPVHGLASFKPGAAYTGVKVAFWKHF